MTSGSGMVLVSGNSPLMGGPDPAALQPFLLPLALVLGLLALVYLVHWLIYSR